MYWANFKKLDEYSSESHRTFFLRPSRQASEKEREFSSESNIFRAPLSLCFSSLVRLASIARIQPLCSPQTRLTSLTMALDVATA